MSFRQSKRTQLLDGETAAEIRALFGQSNNAFRWLKMDELKIPLFTFSRALRGESCREEDLVAIEGRWLSWKQDHDFIPEDFKQLPEIVRARDMPRGARIRRVRDAELVEEDLTITPDSDFF